MDGAEIAKVSGPEDPFRHDLFVGRPFPFSSAEEAEDCARAAVEPGDNGLWKEEYGDLEEPLDSEGGEAKDEGSVFAQEQAAEERQAHLEWWRNKRKSYAFGSSLIPTFAPRRRRLRPLVSSTRILPQGPS